MTSSGVPSLGPGHQDVPAVISKQAPLDTSGAKSTSLTGGGDFVPQERVSMRKVKEVLRLRFGVGLQQNQIARSCSLGQATVHRYLEKAAAAGLSWPLPEDLDDHGWKNCCFRSQPGGVARPRAL